MEATIATDCRRLQGAGREDSSKGESSKRRLLRGLGRRERRRERETRDTSRDLLSLYEESPYEESGVVAFEMQPMTPYEGDDENPHGKGKKKKADKGKAIYRDPWFAQNQNSREEEKRRQVEPEQDEGGIPDLLGDLAKLRLDCDEYEQELELELEHELEQAEGRRVHNPCREAEDGWLVVKEDLDVWDFTDDVGRVLPQ